MPATVLETSGLCVSKSRERTTRQAPNAANRIERLLRYIQKLGDGGFYGRVTVSFQNGRVCDVKIEQTKKLEEL